LTEPVIDFETDPKNDLPAENERLQFIVLFISAGLISICAIVFELLIASLSTYLLGNSVYHFSLTIGLFMFSMGLGSFLSQCLKNNLLNWFVAIELYLGVTGGISSILLFSAFGHTDTSVYYYITMVLLTILIGTGVGFEIPIIIRLVKKISTLPASVANVLAADYIGALIGSLAFPLVLLVKFGLIKTALFVGLLNTVVAAATVIVFRVEIKKPALSFFLAVVIVICFGVTAIKSKAINAYLERRLYRDQIETIAQSPYQRIVLTKGEIADYKKPRRPKKKHKRLRRNAFIEMNGDDFRLFLDGDLQLSSVDEYRYHEALVHPGMSLLVENKDEIDVLILGGGDGMAAREVLRYSEIRFITLVDLDSSVVRLAINNKAMADINNNSLEDPKVAITYGDAFNYLLTSKRRYDFIIVDLPDPDTSALSKLYSVTFYRLVRQHLTKGGLFVTQSTSPYFMPHAFWCIYQTLGSAGFKVYPYTAYVPSFGLWGFNLTSRESIVLDSLALKIDETDFLTDRVMRAMFELPRDVEKLNVKPNTLNRPIIIKYYLGDEDL